MTHWSICLCPECVSLREERKQQGEDDSELIKKMQDKDAENYQLLIAIETALKFTRNHSYASRELSIMKTKLQEVVFWAQENRRRGGEKEE